MRHALALTALMVGAPLAAQFVPDARTVPAGVLRVGFTPRYGSWDEAFDAGGTARRLGFEWLTDSTAVLFPSVRRTEQAVRALSGEASWTLAAGVIDPRLDADARRFPFDFSLGLTSWLTVRATVPIVTTTQNAFPVIDTAGVNAGAATFGTTAAQSAATALTDAADQLAAAVAAGQFGCPGSVQCGDAQQLITRARATAGQLVTLGEGIFQPLATSTAGAALLAAVAQLDTEFQAFGIAPPGVAVTLPATPLDTAGLRTALVDGLGLAPLAPSKHTRKLGDIELGVRVALLSRPGLRLLADVAATLPTAARERPLDPIDLPPGDRQLDLTAGLEAAIENRYASLWLRGSYTVQNPTTVAILPTPFAPDTALVAGVRWDPGDVLQLSLWPALRLTDALRVLVTADWSRREADVFVFPGVVSEPIPVAPDPASIALAIGGGLWYRSTRGRHAGALPIEAGLVYRTVFSGSGVMVPKTRQLDFGLRLFFGL